MKCPGNRGGVHSLGASEPTQKLPAERIGHFRLLSLLGKGAAGNVYLASDTEVKGRRVALKVLSADGLGADLSDVKHEAENLASAEHSHILVFHEIGESDLGPYLVTEYLPGGSMVTRLEQDGAFPLYQALTYATQMADALDAAHRHGVLHRDVKPANLLFDGEGRLKLVDFGLAVRVAQRPSRGIGNSSEATTISAEIMPASPLAGTPGYIAPEVMRGSEPSTHSDQFAFGMTLHEMLTGRHPLEGMSWPQILMNEKIPVDRSLHRDLRRIVERCTAHDPEARYLDMQAVGEDLHAALRRREPRQRLLRRIILGLLGGLILVPVFMYGTHLVHVRQAVELNQQALLLAQQGQLTEAWNLLLQARILAPGEIKPCTNSASLMRLITPDPGAAIEMLKSCAANFPQSDTILYNLGALLARNGSPGEARQPLRTALTLARSDEIRTGALNELALVHMALGHPERGLKLLEERWPAGLRSPVQMSALEKTRGILLLEMDRPDEALRYLKAALADLPKVPKEQAPVRNRILIKTLQGMGRALEALGDLPGALKHYTMMIRSIDEGPAPPGRRQKIVSNMKRLNRLMETGQPAEPLP